MASGTYCDVPDNFKISNLPKSCTILNSCTGKADLSDMKGYNELHIKKPEPSL